VVKEILNLRNGPPRHYSRERVTRADLARLAQIARKCLQSYFERNPEMKCLYGDRYLCTALCQAAAIHAARPQYGYGVKDFDVWTFFEFVAAQGRPRGMFLKHAIRGAFGDSKFGNDPGSRCRSGPPGRRVDLFWRSIAATGANPVQSVRNWLAGTSDSAYYLRQKAVVVIDPPKLRGRLIWLSPKLLGQLKWVLDETETVV
jgi:hypothetical protein